MNFSYVSGVRVDYLAPTLYLTDILFFVLLALYWSVVKKNFIHATPTRMAIFLLFAINVLFAQFSILAAYSVFKFIQIYAVYVLARSMKLTPRFILQAFSAGAVIQLVLTLMQFSSSQSVQGVFYLLGERFMTLTSPGVAKAAFLGREILRPYGTFSHPNSLAGFYVLVYSYALSIKTKSLWRALLMGISSLLIFISFSKLAILTYLFITIMYLIFYLLKPCRLCIIARLTVLVVVAGVFLQTQTDPLTFEKRLSLFKQALLVITQRPVFGTGFGHHLFATTEFINQYAYFFLQPVHNIFILFMMQAGIILSGIVGWQLWAVVNAHWKKIALPLLVIFITGSGDHYWLTLQQNMLLMGTIFGLLDKKSSSAYS